MAHYSSEKSLNFIPLNSALHGGTPQNPSALNPGYMVDEQFDQNQSGRFQIVLTLLCAGALSWWNKIFLVLVVFFVLPG